MSERDDRIKAIIRESEAKFFGDYEAHRDAGRHTAAEVSLLIAQSIALVGIQVEGVMNQYDDGPTVESGDGEA